MIKKLLLSFAFGFLFIFSSVSYAPKAYACCSPGCLPTQCGCCAGVIGRCQTHCICVSTAETGTSDKPKTTTGHVTDEFSKHRKWMVDLFFNDEKPNDPPGLRAAMKLMTSQLTALSIQKVQIIGTFFDAKHQMETQRIFQQLTAEAHRDYHPNEELCEFGTVTRSLSASGRNSDLTAAGLSRRSVERQVHSKNNVSAGGIISDQESRLTQFVKKYCDKKDNLKDLDLLCAKGGSDATLFNKDISYTSTIDAPLTLDLDFSKNDTATTEDEHAIFALMANLFAHDLFQVVAAKNLVTLDGKDPSFEGAAKAYLDARALMAKRSVATNSIASIAALKTKGDAESQPFIYALLKEMGNNKMTATEIKKLIGDKPSYYAQMEILTKKLYQSPEFYANLYDKPANVLRKDVAVQAATLMQKRDLYRSYLRSEMVLAVILESALIEEQDRVVNEINKARKSEKGRKIK